MCWGMLFKLHNCWKIKKKNLSNSIICNGHIKVKYLVSVLVGAEMQVSYSTHLVKKWYRWTPTHYVCTVPQFLVQSALRLLMWFSAEASHQQIPVGSLQTDLRLDTKQILARTGTEPGWWVHLVVLSAGHSWGLILPSDFLKQLIIN